METTGGESKMGINEYLQLKETTGDCFRLLSACFYPPKKQLFLQEGLFRNLTTALKRVCPEACVFSEKMEEAFLSDAGDELMVEYARLFVGPYELKAPPYGSVYLDQERRAMGDSTMEVIKIYEEAGLSIADDFKELPDHIAVELEFMYYLIYQEVEALKNAQLDTASATRKIQERFLNRFLKPWILRFCTKIRENTENEFYNVLASCVVTLISNLTLAQDVKRETSQFSLT